MKAIILPLALLAAVGSGQADTLRHHVKEIDDQIGAALKNRDAGKFSYIMRSCTTSDFNHVEMGRSSNIDETLAGMKQGLGSMKKMTHVSSRILRVKEKGSEGTAEVRREMSGLMIGPDKKTHTMTFNGTTVDVYRRVGGKWKMASMTWKDEKQLLDGKPMGAPPAARQK